MALDPPETDGLQVGTEGLLPALRGVPRAVKSKLEFARHLPAHLILLW